jgi:hypothetical protein
MGIMKALWVNIAFNAELQNLLVWMFPYWRRRFGKKKFNALKSLDLKL